MLSTAGAESRQSLKSGTQSRSSNMVAGAQDLELSPLLPRVCTSKTLKLAARAGDLTKVFQYGV